MGAWTHNIWLTFAYRVCDGIATGIWSSSVLSNYIYTQQGEERGNEKVGIAQAVQGTFLVAAAIPAAWAAGYVRRDGILKIMGLVSYAAIASTASALVYYEGEEQYRRLCVSLALWGVAQANAPVLDALFADSVTTGKRTKLYTLLHICYILSQGLGPGVAALLFYLQGDEWSAERLRLVMLTGMTLAAVPASLLLMFDDDKALGEESEGLLKVLGRGRARVRARSSKGDVESSSPHQPLLQHQHYLEGRVDAGHQRHHHDGEDDNRSNRSSYFTDDEHDLEGFDELVVSDTIGGDNLLSASPGPHNHTLLSASPGPHNHTLITVPTSQPRNPHRRLTIEDDPLPLPFPATHLVTPPTPEGGGPANLLAAASRLHAATAGASPSRTGQQDSGTGQQDSGTSHHPGGGGDGGGDGDGGDPGCQSPTDHRAQQPLPDPDSHAIDFSDEGGTHYSSDINGQSSQHSSPHHPYYHAPAGQSPSPLPAHQGSSSDSQTLEYHAPAGQTPAPAKAPGRASPPPPAPGPSLVPAPALSQAVNAYLRGRIGTSGPFFSLQTQSIAAMVHAQDRRSSSPLSAHQGSSPSGQQQQQGQQGDQQGQQQQQGQEQREQQPEQLGQQQQEQQGQQQSERDGLARHSRKRSDFMPTLEESAELSSDLMQSGDMELLDSLNSISSGPLPSIANLRNQSMVGASTSSLGDWLGQHGASFGPMGGPSGLSFAMRPGHPVAKALGNLTSLNSDSGLGSSDSGGGGPSGLLLPGDNSGGGGGGGGPSGLLLPGDSNIGPAGPSAGVGIGPAGPSGGVGIGPAGPSAGVGIGAAGPSLASVDSVDAAGRVASLTFGRLAGAGASVSMSPAGGLVGQESGAGEGVVGVTGSGRHRRGLPGRISPSRLSPTRSPSRPLSTSPLRPSRAAQDGLPTPSMRTQPALASPQPLPPILPAPTVVLEPAALTEPASNMDHLSPMLRGHLIDDCSNGASSPTMRPTQTAAPGQQGFMSPQSPHPHANDSAPPAPHQHPGYPPATATSASASPDKGPPAPTSPRQSFPAPGPPAHTLPLASPPRPPPPPDPPPPPMTPLRTSPSRAACYT